MGEKCYNLRLKAKSRVKQGVNSIYISRQRYYPSRHRLREDCSHRFLVGSDFLLTGWQDPLLSIEGTSPESGASGMLSEEI